jgi:DNA adenine methylase
MSATDSRTNRLEAVRTLSIRLDRTLVEELDWKECVRRYDRPTTFFFCDPPYTDCGNPGYKAWAEADVLRLREVLGAVRGKWLVTLNDSPAVRGIFGGCDIVSVDRPLGISHKAGRRRYRELISRPSGQGPAIKA